MKWLRQVKGLKNDRNVYLERVGALFILAILTFAIPLLQWLADKLIKPSGYSTLAGNILTVTVFGYWSLRNNLFDYFPTIPVGRAIVYFLWVSLLILLFLNVQHRPVSGITGQARSPYEVVDVIVLGSMAEELVFRGTMWLLLKRLSRWASKGNTALMGTSVLFGKRHLG